MVSRRVKKIQEYLSCLAHTMRENGIHANRRIAENVTCKSTREMNDTNSQFKDLYVAGMNLYEMVSPNRISVKMPHRPNDKVILQKGLLEYFPFNNKWVLLTDLIDSAADVTQLRLQLEEESRLGQLPEQRRNCAMDCLSYDTYPPRKRNWK